MAEHVRFSAACVQLRSGLSRDDNLRQALDLIGRAADSGAQFVATPEMTNVVDRNARRMLASLPFEDGLEELAAFAAAAREHRIHLLIGSLAVNLGEGRAANRSYFFSPAGDLVARYDKMHMFDVDLPAGESWKESNVYRPGVEARAVRSDLGVFGLSICYDVRFPHLYRALAQAGAEILCIPAAFTRQTGEAHWRVLMRARAIENGAFVIAPAQGGRHEDGRDTFGHSIIVDPWGEVLGEAQGDEPGVVVAEIDTARAAEARRRIPNLALENSIKVGLVDA